MKRQNNKKANALITSLSMLLAISVMGITFVQIASLERDAANNYSSSMEASFVAQAGINYAIISLTESFDQNVRNLSNDWLYVNTKTNIAAAGMAPKDVNSYSDIRPSYQRLIAKEDEKDPIKGRKASGEVGDSKKLYTLKIFDTTSQINLNNQIIEELSQNQEYGVENMGNILDTLSSEVAKLEPYKTEVGGSIGPLKQLGDEIIRLRNKLGGFSSKNEIIGEYTRDEDGIKVEITKEDLHYIWDYITIHPTLAEMKKFRIYQNIKSPDLTAKGDSYVAEYRSPININTASLPVLVATLSNIKTGSGSSSVEMTLTNAQTLASKIIANTEDFKDWDTFNEFLMKQTEENGAFYKDDDSAAKIGMVSANADPNVILNRGNPDVPVYQAINKLNLTKHSSEFCFHPLGNFEITSLGEILNDKGKVLISSKKYVLVKIFDAIYYTSQYDFEGGNSKIFYATGTTPVPDLTIRQGVYEEGVKGLNAFSYGNNLQKTFKATGNLFDASSHYFGYIMPLGYELPDNMASKLFAINFNGSYDGQTFPGKTIISPSGDTEFTQSELDPALPGPKGDKTSATSSLFPDGVVFSLNDQSNSQILYYETPADSGVFPTLAPGLNNNGTITFWFKLNSDWIDDTNWHTIFLATNSQDTMKGVYGIQREIQMQVCGPSPDAPLKIDPKAPLLRRVKIRVRNKYFNYDVNGNPLEPTVILYDHIKYDRVINLNPKHAVAAFGVHAHEWYSFGVRWKDGTAMAGFSNSGGNQNDTVAVVVCGNFYFYDEYGAEKLSTDHYVQDFMISNDPSDDILAKTDELQDSDFAAIYPTVKNTNRFYLGSGGFTASPSITIDDFRIYGVVDKGLGIDKALYLPSRFPEEIEIYMEDVQKPKEKKDAAKLLCYGGFQGYFKGENSGMVSSLSWTSRKWGEMEPVKRAYLINDHSWAVWEKLWSMMTDNALSLKKYKEWLFKPPSGKTISISVNFVTKTKGGSTRYYKEVTVETTGKGGKKTTKEALTSTETPIETESQGYPYSTATTDGISTDANGFMAAETSGSSNLCSFLENWFIHMQTFGYFAGMKLDDLEEDTTSGYTPLDKTGEPYAISINKNFTYTLLFPITEKNVAIYKSPLIDDITLLYKLDHVIYKEIKDGSLLP